MSLVVADMAMDGPLLPLLAVKAEEEAGGGLLLLLLTA